MSQDENNIIDADEIDEGSPDAMLASTDGLDRKKAHRTRYRRKTLDTRNLVIDYKNPETLERFIGKTGKILPRRLTGATAKIQRMIAREIKRARMINLLPFARR